MFELPEDIKKAFEKRKNLSNPPKYVETMKKLLELEGIETDNQE